MSFQNNLLCLGKVAIWVVSLLYIFSLDLVHIEIWKPHIARQPAISVPKQEAILQCSKVATHGRGAAQCRMQMLSQAKSTMHELGLIYKGSRLGPSASTLVQRAF